jgi:hypothetical protein
LTEKAISRAAASRTEIVAVLVCSAAASLAAIVWSWRNHALLNWGDAVAHLHIARRVFDSHQPRLSQLGSVWLPLPHILMIPFVQVYGWWANGIAGAIPSALAYIAACAGIYRLARRWLQPAAAALTFFAINPNLLYLQTTAMTEPLFVCEMIWIVVWLVDWRTQNMEWRTALDEDAGKSDRLLIWIAAALVAAIYTRYDGWVIALLAWTSIGLVLLKQRRLRSRTFWLASAFIVAAPVIWFNYNAAAFGDWLEFARGPYSAKAIELRTQSHGAGPPHPGWHDPWVSLLFFLKASEMDATAIAWGNTLLAFCALGTLGAWLFGRRRAFTWALLLWLPVPYYAYSVAYSSVPIFLPPWWPHSWYNTRYGMELLPALALGVGFIASLVIGAVRDFKPQWAKYAAAALVALAALNAWRVLREHPLTYVEGIKNIEAHRPYQTEIPPVLRSLLVQHPGATILMETSVDPEIVALTGIPLRQTINEADLEIWDTALKAPAQHAGIVLAFDGDAVDCAVKRHPEGLTDVEHFTAKGQPSGTLYVSDTPGSSSVSSRPAAVIASGKVTPILEED